MFLDTKTNMENFIEKLTKYFETTPREKVLEDWAKTEKFGEVGPTMDEFLAQTELNFKLKAKAGDPSLGCNLRINKYSPKFSSGFFLIKPRIYATSSIFN